MRPARGRRPGESGQTGAEFFLLGLGILAIATTMTVAVGGWAAATYDQQHSHDALAQAAPAVTHPSVSFTDFSPVGLYEDCIVRVAGGLGLTWDGGALGWTSAANPRPRGADGLDDSKVQAWRDRMSAELGAAAGSVAWKACSLPQLSPTVPQSPPPADTIVVDGQYTIDPNATQSVGTCGSGGGVAGMQVGGNGTRITLYFYGTGQGTGTTLTGTFDTSSYAVDGSLTESDGTRHTLRGSFSSNAGVTRFHGVYETPVDSSSCGYDFTSQKN